MKKSERKEVSSKDRHKLYYLQQSYLVYLAVLPGLAFYGIMDYYFSNGITEAGDIFSASIIGGLITVIFYSVVTEIVQVPEDKFAAMFMILDAPILLLGLKLFGADISYLQFLTLDYFIEASGFLVCLGILAIFPSLNKNRPIGFDKNFSTKGFLVAGVIGAFVWILYNPHGFILVEFLKRQSIFNQIPVYVAYLSTVYMYIRYMSSGFSRNNVNWIFITIACWIVGVASAYVVVSTMY